MLDENGRLRSPTFAVCVGVDLSVVVDAGGVSTDLRKMLCQTRTASVPAKFVLVLASSFFYREALVRTVATWQERQPGRIW